MLIALVKVVMTHGEIVVALFRRHFHPASRKLEIVRNERLVGHAERRKVVNETERRAVAVTLEFLAVPGVFQGKRHRIQHGRIFIPAGRIRHKIVARLVRDEQNGFHIVSALEIRPGENGIVEFDIVVRLALEAAGSHRALLGVEYIARHLQRAHRHLVNLLPDAHQDEPVVRSLHLVGGDLHEVEQRILKTKDGKFVRTVLVALQGEMAQVLVRSPLCVSFLDERIADHLVRQ